MVLIVYMVFMTKIYHKAKHMKANGDVSALCFKSPRKINLKKSGWVLIDENVTCPKCKKLLIQGSNENEHKG